MTPYLGTFHAVNVFKNMDSICSVYPRIWTTEAYPGHHDLLVYVIKNEFVKFNPKIRCYSDYKKLQAFKNTIYHGRTNIWQYPFKNWQYPEFYFLIKHTYFEGFFSRNFRMMIFTKFFEFLETRQYSGQISFLYVKKYFNCNIFKNFSQHLNRFLDCHKFSILSLRT